MHEGSVSVPLTLHSDICWRVSEDQVRINYIHPRDGTKAGAEEESVDEGDPSLLRCSRPETRHWS
jgi:hypothetical protein